jgi:hypothetical protein
LAPWWFIPALHRRASQFHLISADGTRVTRGKGSANDKIGVQYSVFGGSGSKIPRHAGRDTPFSKGGRGGSGRRHQRGSSFALLADAQRISTQRRGAAKAQSLQCQPWLMSAMPPLAASISADAALHGLHGEICCDRNGGGASIRVSLQSAIYNLQMRRRNAI